MNHYALAIEYDGTQYHGFQKQRQVETIQETLEKALSEVAAEAISVVPSGRTDVGVHATSQVVSFSCHAHRPSSAWINGTNRYLRNDISVISANTVHESFHARFSAQWRRYLYVFGNKREYQVFNRNYASWVDVEFNVNRMSKVAQLFMGEHDFSSVRAAGCGSNTPCRHVYLSQVQQLGHFVVFDIVANAFLMHMVRNLAAILRMVGEGRWYLNEVRQLMAAKDRTLAPPTAPACGLYLVAVGYDEGHGLTQTMRVPSVLSQKSEMFEEVNLPSNHFQREISQ